MLLESHLIKKLINKCELNCRVHIKIRKTLGLVQCEFSPSKHHMVSMETQD